MTHLTEGNTYLISFTKLNKGVRTMLATVTSLPIGSRHAFVVEHLVGGSTQPRTVIRDSITSVIPAILKPTEVIVKPQHTSTCQKVLESRVEALQRLEAYQSLQELTELFPKVEVKKERSLYSFKPVAGYYVVKHCGVEIGKAYLPEQIEKLITHHKQYRRK